jgi:voltage-gated potassium channel
LVLGNSAASGNNGDVNRRARVQHLRADRTRLDVARQVRWLAAALVSVLVIGTVGYMVLGLSLLDAAFSTVFVVTTVGFAEPYDLDTAGKLFTILLMLGGIGTVLYTLTLLVAIFVDGHVSTLLEGRRMQRDIDGMRDHIIVCGYGRVGRASAHQLAKSGRDVVVVDRAAARLESCSYLSVEGDSTDDDVLRLAGVERAYALVASLENDADSLFVTLSARALNERLLIIARSRTEEATPKFERAGADRVVNPQRLGGDRIAAFTLQPHVVDFLDVAMHDAEIEFRLEDFEVAEGSALAGTSVREARHHEGGGAMLLALRVMSGQFITNPPADRVIVPGDAVIAIGTEAQLAALRSASQT